MKASGTDKQWIRGAVFPTKNMWLLKGGFNIPNFESLI